MFELLNEHQVDTDRLLTPDCVTGIASLRTFLKQNFVDADPYMAQVHASEKNVYGPYDEDMPGCQARLIAQTLLMAAEYGMSGIFNHLKRHESRRYIGDHFDPRHILGTASYLGFIQQQILPQKLALIDELHALGHASRDVINQIFGYFQPPDRGEAALALHAGHVINKCVRRNEPLVGRLGGIPLPVYEPSLEKAQMAGQLPYRNETAHTIRGIDIWSHNETLSTLFPSVDFREIAQLVEDRYIPYTQQFEM